MLHLVQVLAQVTASNPTPFEFVSQHLHLIGWPALCLIALKASWAVAKFVNEAKAQVQKTVTQIDLLATNHFPHMEASLTKQDGILEKMGDGVTSIDSSLKTLVAVMSKN